LQKALNLNIKEKEFLWRNAKRNVILGELCGRIFPNRNV